MRPLVQSFLDENSVDARTITLVLNNINEHVRSVRTHRHRHHCHHPRHRSQRNSQSHENEPLQVAMDRATQTTSRLLSPQRPSTAPATRRTVATTRPSSAYPSQTTVLRSPTPPQLYPGGMEEFGRSTYLADFQGSPVPAYATAHVHHDLEAVCDTVLVYLGESNRVCSAVIFSDPIFCTMLTLGTWLHPRLIDTCSTKYVYISHRYMDNLSALCTLYPAVILMDVS